MSNIYYLYRHIRPDKNEVFYIGLGSYQKKWKYERANCIKSRNKHWKNIVNLCNNVFKVELLFDNITKEEAIKKEIEFIKLYGREDLKQGTLCNLTDGGEGTFNMTYESRLKISNAKKGSNNPMYGKKLSKDSLLKKSIKMKGVNNHNFGKPLSDWQKDINRKAQLGRKQSKQTIEARVTKIRKQVLNTLTNIIYPSIQDVAIVFGKSPSHMTRLIKLNKYNLKFI